MNRFLALLIFFISALVGVESIYAQIAGGSVSAADARGLPELPPLSEEELELFAQIFENMDEKTLEALAQIGEEYIKEMEAQGKDPYEIFREPLIPPTQPPVKPKPAEPKIPAGQQPIILMPPEKTKEMRALLQEIAHKLEHIQRKAEADRELADAVKPWKYHFEDLVYFAHQLEQEKIVNYLFDKDFSPLLASIKELHQTLGMLDAQFSVPEVSIESDKSYGILGVTSRAPFPEIQQAYQNLLREKSPALIKKQLEGKPLEELSMALDINEDQLNAINKAYQTIVTREQSKQVLARILETLHKAIYTQNIIESAKKLLQKYEPEALKIKEEQEKREATARKEQEEAIKRRPPLAPRVFEPSFGRGGGDFGYTPTGGGFFPSIPSTTPSTPAGKPGEAVTPSGKPGEKGKKEDKKKDEKKKDEKKKDEKKEEKKEKEGEKKRIKEMPASTDQIKKKLDKLTDLYEDFLNYLTEKSIKHEGAVDLAAVTIAPKEIFKDLEMYLTGPVAKPYDKTTPVLIRAKDMIAALTQMTEFIHKIKKEIRNMGELSRAEKREFKKSVQTLFDEYEIYIKKEIPELMRLKITPDLKVITATGAVDINKEKKYLLFGINDSLGDMSMPEFAVLTELNPPIIPATDDEPAKQTNYLGQFIDAYQGLAKEVKPELGIPPVPVPA
jgi:hypothetical protein